MATRQNHRPLLVATTSLVALAGLTGCASDTSERLEELEAVNLGTNAEVGSVSFGNMLVVTSGDGQPARLMGVLLHSSEEPVDVTIADADDSTDVTLAPGQQFAFQENAVVFDTADDRPGSRIELTLSVGGEQDSVPVPVRNGTLEWLEPYLPEGS
ncbi:MAG: hypothetical protein Q7T15_05215 [Microcella sp.]|uniref:hypothetical protein n=1 Tax=Microcella sp. TaxID=1913979 RepID=UPI00271D3A88|nr:hypothetical protein [Microcella sp.]MDO8337634.1 hypothetical protein [Microcella sp.]